ncbi:TetR/AcrR family transcriptional regulator [Haloferax mediterranei ATCC 33500]|uniref:DNA-binding protein n=1 Tax=Haloferax mediterranei (strain ATCC 33500 / DSM 1411 / JCM 8866 / NBRC 14739 / NCIMB 2177 / R-4) TaxID=523841 RepID=I3R8B1_HALMT|nr:TetR/AcrR family transcriptional regulator [Haloferax mediterranei]AFK20471.1 DNA binding protein [Haloferax mediterranei ATCC 33500]AHZ23833.1 DNA-binding protein [Haloferax mediterranei ATCC 33500]ELZ98256.1 DNA binding protein [Haloferax mediterranei ATCC 33500]MDX5986772.1 TetR/AcrR family transcriptional regulator [Haloferax mediterranei ATCC 33500]QCQ76097.1 TetR/AcrR family transcriptional regulator [Haloferax mediterranei ATCC 33500]
MDDERIDTGRSETEQAIMDATLRALAEHGYADLSIKNIGTEFEKSTSLLYYHYENKDELLLAFLDYIIDLFVASIDPDADDPDAELREFVEYVLPPEDGPDTCDTIPPAVPFHEDAEPFQRVIFELRTQTIHDEAYREKFGRMESHMVETVTALIRREMDAGNYREMNAEIMAENLMAFLFRSLDVRITGTRPESAHMMRESVYFLLDNVMPKGSHPEDAAREQRDFDA